MKFDRRLISCGACLIIAALTGGCVSGFGPKVTASVVMMEEGAEISLPTNHYIEVQGALRAVLAENGLGLAAGDRAAKWIATVEVRRRAEGAGYAVVAVRGVATNPAWRSIFTNWAEHDNWPLKEPGTGSTSSSLEVPSVMRDR